MQTYLSVIVQDFSQVCVLKKLNVYTIKSHFFVDKCVMTFFNNNCSMNRVFGIILYLLMKNNVITQDGTREL